MMLKEPSLLGNELKNVFTRSSISDSSNGLSTSIVITYSRGELSNLVARDLPFTMLVV